MRLVIIESPYAGKVDVHMAYLRSAMADCVKRGEAPFASHGLYPQVLDDLDPRQRAQGIDAGLAWATKADATVVYVNLGISPGMLQGILHAHGLGRPIEFRRLLEWEHREAERIHPTRAELVAALAGDVAEDPEPGKAAPFIVEAGRGGFIGQ